MKKIINILVFIAISATALYSQGGSNYSVNGFGDLTSSVSAGYNGLAGTQIAMPSAYMINMRNPAMWSYVQTTRLQAGYQFNQMFAQNETISLKQNNGKISGVLALFSIDTAMGIGVSFGIHPYSNVNYYLRSPFTVKMEGLEFSGTSTYIGEGGLTLAYLGASTKIYKGLTAGAEIFSTIGSISYKTTTVVSGDNNYPGINEKFDRFYGLGFKGGLSYNFPFGLYLGLCGEYHSSLNYDRDIIYSSQTISDSVTSTVNKLKVPASIGFGAAYKTGKFLIGFDFTSQNFSNFDYQRGSEVKFTNNNNFSIGFSRLGSKTYSADFLDKVSYNIGFGYNQLHYTVKGTQINDLYGSIGLEMPIVSGTMLNTALQIGTRGQTGNGLIKENYGKLTIDISVGDNWFKPFKRDYE